MFLARFSEILRNLCFELRNGGNVREVLELVHRQQPKLQPFYGIADNTSIVHDLGAIGPAKRTKTFAGKWITSGRIGFVHMGIGFNCLPPSQTLSKEGGTVRHHLGDFFSFSIK